MRNVKYNLYVIHAISFMDGFGIGLMFPLLQPYLRSLGATHFTIGVMGSMYSALQVLAGPLIGSWSDLRGRKIVLLSTLTVCVLCYFLLGYFSSLFVIFVLRFILGFTKHTQTLCKAMIADLLPKTEHAQAYGRSSGLVMLGFVIGPVIGGHVSQIENGFQFVCSITSSLFLINILLSLLIPNTKGASPTSENINILQLLKAIHIEFKKATLELTKINWAAYWDSFLIRFLFGITVSIFHSNQSLYLQERYNLSQLYIGYTISFFSIIGVISSLLLGWISKTFYKDDIDCIKRVYHSFIILSICCIGFYSAPDLYTFYLFLIPYAVSTAILRIVSMEMMLTKSKNEEKGSLSGASNSVMSMSRFITPLSSGVIGDLFGEQSIMFSAFVPALTGTIVTFKLLRIVQSRRKTD